ncbi:MAG TPA: RidA family protein [Acidimicrobiales bacterium]|nr:RidA family protein [Acidimicrobiales bacterium]
MPAEGLSMLRPASFGPPRGTYSPGVLAEAPGRILYVAGQTASDSEGRIVSDDFTAQTRRVFENIGAVLAEAGMDFGNVVKLNYYLVNADHMPELVTLREELWPVLFPDGAFPAATLCVVSRLGRAEVLVEIEAIAVDCTPAR